MHRFVAILAFALPALLAAQNRSAVDVFIGENLNGGMGVLGADFTPLTGGNLSVEGDGAVVQLGYFDSATLENPFGGNFIALTGIGGSNSAYSSTSIGDTLAFLGDPAVAGYFAQEFLFEVGSPTSGVNLPAAGAMLAIRFYNAPTIAASTHYNSVTSTDLAWKWVAPAFPTSPGAALLDSHALIWQDAANPGATTIAVPEPAAYAALLGMATLGLVAMRRRRS